MSRITLTLDRDPEWEAWYDNLIPCPKCRQKLWVCNMEYNRNKGTTNYNRWCYFCGHEWVEEGEWNCVSTKKSGPSSASLGNKTPCIGGMKCLRK